MKITTSLLALAAVVCTSALNAATIRYDVKVAGYSGAGWIQVRSELRSVLGGRVAYLPQYGGWVTDRVSRGESIRTTITPDRASERHCRGALVGVSVNGQIVGFQDVLLPVTSTRTVSTNPNVDNVVVSVITEAGSFEKRVPIGTRGH